MESESIPYLSIAPDKMSFKVMLYILTMNASYKGIAAARGITSNKLDSSLLEYKAALDTIYFKLKAYKDNLIKKDVIEALKKKLDETFTQAIATLESKYKYYKELKKYEELITKNVLISGLVSPQEEIAISGVGSFDNTKQVVDQFAKPRRE